MKKKPLKKQKKETDILKLAAKFLNENGWKAIVIGPAQVRQPIGSFKYNFEFVLPFTGSKK